MFSQFRRRAATFLGLSAGNSVKYASEIEYWRSRWSLERPRFSNAHYEKVMLGMAGEDDGRFLQNQIVADFGCGPRGSLCWITGAKAKIGIDVLADSYSEFSIREHDMIYMTSSEVSIPLPTNYVDTLYTMNALDHVDNLSQMCVELVRILKPGGTIIGSFNLDEPPSECEPQTLSEDKLNQILFCHFEVASYRVAFRGPDEDTYKYFFSPAPDGLAGTRFLWFRGTKL